MLAARISSKGQITLPRSVRKALNAAPGDRVFFTIDNGAVSLRSLGPCSAADLAGSLKRYAKAPASTAEVRGLVRREVAHAAAREG